MELSDQTEIISSRMSNVERPREGPLATGHWKREDCSRK